MGMIRNWSYPSVVTPAASASTGAAYLKGAAAPLAAGPFNSTLHTGDSILGLNVCLFYFITYAIAWGPVEHGFPVANLFLALRTFCLAC